MMEKQQTRIAIAASLLWMAMATFLILGTHGPTAAQTDAAMDAPAEAATAERMALPASDTGAQVRKRVVFQC